MDGNFPVSRPSLLFFPKEVKQHNFFHFVLGKIDAGNESFPLFEEFTAKRLILFANGSIITVIVHLAPSLSTERYNAKGHTVLVVDTSASMACQ